MLVLFGRAVSRTNVVSVGSEVIVKIQVLSLPGTIRGINVGVWGVVHPPDICFSQSLNECSRQSVSKRVQLVSKYKLFK